MEASERLLLELALEPVYQELIEDDVIAPWKSPVCVDWSSLAKPIAEDVLHPFGYTASHVAYDPPTEIARQHALPKSYHEYLIGRADNTEYIIDGTWQQFTGMNYDMEGSRIMIAPVDQAVDVMRHAGVNPGWSGSGG